MLLVPEADCDPVDVDEDGVELEDDCEVVLPLLLEDPELLAAACAWGLNVALSEPLVLCEPLLWFELEVELVWFDVDELEDV